jgi:hypothetical protein
MKPLMRESPHWTRLFVLGAALSIPSAYFAGVQLRFVLAHFFSTHAKSILLAAAPQRASVIFEPEPPRTRFMVPFGDEGGCVPRGEARGWHGAAPSTWTRAIVAEIAQNLAACSTPEHRVKIEVVGFASSSEFKEPVDCGADIKTSAQANLRLANARAENVKALLDRKLTNGEVLVRQWSDFLDMEDEKAFSDKLSSGKYDPRKGPLNRRAEIRVLDGGACE